MTSPLPADAGIKATVVVPVFNPGPYLDRCIASLLGQSLPPDAFEVIFVDDGSTDGSPATLDALAATHANMRVIHQPNSGWPGQPRNLGIEAARGRYIQFLDHDDALGAEALERLCAFADRNASDIVIGKMAGHGRGVPRELFLGSRDRVSVHDSGIVAAMSPHKLFRTAFLRRTGIRFPEGRRRLEDHVFVLKAYFATDAISILADTTCYYHLARDDHANAASGIHDPSGTFDPAFYFRFVREVLDVIETNTEPGRARDRLLRRFVIHQVLGRITEWRFRASSADQRERVVDEVAAIVERYIPASVDAMLPQGLRVLMALVRAGRRDLLLPQVRAEAGVNLVTRFRSLEPADGRFVLELEGELARSGRPLVFPLRDGRLLLPVPGRVASAVPAASRAIGQPPDGDTLVVLQRRSDSAEIVLRVPDARRVVAAGDGVRVVDVVRVEIDPATLHDGAASRGEVWSVSLRQYLAGARHETRVGRPAGAGRVREVAFRGGAPMASPATWRWPMRVPDVVKALGTTRAGRRALHLASRVMRRRPRR